MWNHSAKEQAGVYVPDRIPLIVVLKKAFYIGLPFILVACVAIAAHYHVQINSIEKNMRTLSGYATENLSRSLTLLIRNIIGDAQLIASHPLLEIALSNPQGSEAQRLVQEWKTFMGQKRIYDQVRLLSLDGQELLRINLTPDGAIAVPREELQNKAGRYYFSEAMTLESGQIYLSTLDLNIEQKKIERPLKPILRISIPIADKLGRKVGLVVLNNLADILLLDVDAHSRMSNSKTLLLNEEGYYLRGFRPEDEWAFMYPKAERSDGRFSLNYPAVWSQIMESQQGQVLNGKGLFTYRWVTTGDLTKSGSYDRRFVVLSAVTADQMEALTLPYYQTAWATGVLVILAIFIISGLASRYRLRGILAVQRLREAERDQRVILETVGEGIIGVDRDARLTFVNSRAVELTGYTAEEMMGSDLGKVIKIHDEEKKVSVTESSTIQNCLFDAATCRSDKEVLRHKSGASFPVEYICNPITRDGHLIGAVVSFLDITERKDAERHIQHLVLYDALTDIPNRTLLTDRLSQQIAIAKQTQKIGALLYIDIDRFKQINDAIGHAQGDNILTEVAKRLNEIVQKGDTIARIDSDEFVLLQAAKALSTEQAAHDAQLAAYDVMLALEQPYWVNGEAIRLTASIGIAIYPGTDDDVTAVLSKADTAAARAKSAGRNTSRFFTDDMERDTKGWFSIHNRLLEALANDTFTMAYQPLVRQNGKVIGLEALLRWEDPVLGKVSPTEFVTIAEESGLILQLSDIVLSKVCQQIREWMDAGLGETIGRVAINISATLFAHKDFVVYVSNHLERTGIPPNAIELEITERALVSDILDTRRKVDRLRQIGVHFSIDDFGTGYSSLSYLQQLPIDRLKIDRSFITEVNKRQNQQTIVKAIIQLAKGLSLEVIAEGVESEDEMRYLLDTGCSEFQGYYFSYPKSGTDLTDLLKRKSLARRLH